MLGTGTRVEKRPLGNYVEYDFHADLKCSCGLELSVHFFVAEYSDGIILEESERCEAIGCACIEPPDMDYGRLF